ncbi:MAG: VOC family protein [Oscillospiraceae bacterium]|nr:VOC family protein [Oscillospiraceae bacterium]
MFTFNHVCHNVVNVEQSVEFYKKYFGLVKVRELGDETRKLVFLAIPDTTDFTIELIWTSDHNEPFNLGEKSFHFAFYTDDFDRDFVAHKKAGIIVIEQLEKKIYFVEDPDGYRIEILEQR